MRIIELLSTRSAATDVTTIAFDLNDLTTFSIQVTFSGSDVVGGLKLQASIDNVTFVDVANSSQAVSASASHVWDVSGAGYRYIKVAWDYTSGTGNIGVILGVKEPIVKFN